MSAAENKPKLLPLPEYKYFVDVVKPELIAGWALNTQEGAANPVIEVYSGDTLLWSTSANIPRKDLAEAGLGDAAFSIIPDKLKLSADIEAIDILIDGHKVNESAYPLAMKAAKLGDYQCVIDKVKPQEVLGWGYNKTEINHRPKVELKVDDIILGQATADVFRADLLNAKIGDGHYGFTIKLDLASFPQETVTATVYIDGLKSNLKPIELTTTAEEIRQAKFAKQFAEHLGDFDQLMEKEATRFNQQIEALSSDNEQPSLNLVTNVAVRNIVELSTRVAVLERIVSQYVIK